MTILIAIIGADFQKLHLYDGIHLRHHSLDLTFIHRGPVI